MSEENKEVVRRWQEAYNSGSLDLLEELLAPDWVSNSWPDGVPHTIDGLKQIHQYILSLWPDWHFTTEDLIAEVDRVVQRFICRGTHGTADFVDIPPNGNRFEFGGTSIFRIREGRIAEQWTYAGELQFLHQQLGAPLPEAWVPSSHLTGTGCRPPLTMRTAAVGRVPRSLRPFIRK